MKNNKEFSLEFCPKCNSAEIYTTKGIKRTFGARSMLPVSSINRIFLDTYICVDCGYFVEILRKKDLENKKIILSIKKKWNKVK